MKLRFLLFGAIGLIATLGLGHTMPADDQPAATFARDVLPFLTKHCYACHGNGKKKADLALDKFKDDESVQKDRKTWENVLFMIKTGEMPPKEKARPPAKEIEAVLKSIDGVLAKLDCSGVRNAGRVTLRRLNKTEYNNTIRDLLGMDFKPAADFPNDDVGYGFDNIGDVLSISPLLLEKYLSAAESILDHAIVIVDPPKSSRTRLGSLRASFNSGVTGRDGNYLHSKGEMSGESFLEEGDYIVRAEVYGVQVGPEPVRASLRVNRNELKQFDVKAKGPSSAETLESRVRIKTGTARVGVSFLNPYSLPKPEPTGKAAIKEPAKDSKTPPPARPEEQKKAEATSSADKKEPQQRLLYIRSISVEGPFNPPPPSVPESHKRIMGSFVATDPSGDKTPDSKACREAARTILTGFATQAFRRPARADEVDRCLVLYDQAEKTGERFENRIRTALFRVLVSPHFLYRVELDPPNSLAGSSYLVNEYELASRLSYFLWSSMPDEELFNLAARGQLRANLDAQVQRMLKDPKSAALAQNFVEQWLTTRKLAYVSPDPKTFPQFDEELRASMARETELFFDAVMREDRSVLDFIDADFSFVNERLAKHYGIEGVKGKKFQRVKLPANRGGILTQASVLTLTSNSSRTSPVKRGKWVLDQILNTPPPPPPPDVPDLAEEKQLLGSLRKRMEEHRQNPVCASCHAKMDPIGFAFENFDAIGRWRDKDGKFPIDATGVLPDGKSFNGPKELKEILKSKKELFSRCLGEKMLTYALGRGLEYYDKCAVDKILAALDRDNYRFSTLVVEVIKSEPFQMRTATGTRSENVKNDR